MNRNLLRYYMALNKDVNKDLAQYLGISEQSLSAKINENGTEFRQGEIAKIKTRYNLAAKEVEAIFFN